MTKKQSAARIKKARRRLQWTQKSLAARLGYEPTRIWRYENPAIKAQMTNLDLTWLESMAKQVPLPMRYYVVTIDQRFGANGTHRFVVTKHLIAATSTVLALKAGIACAYHGNLEEDVKDDMDLLVGWAKNYIFSADVSYTAKGAVEVKKYIFDILRKYF